MNISRNRFSFLIFLLLLTVFVGYLGVLLYDSVKVQFGENIENFVGIFRFLVGYLLLVGVVFLMGWLNYRGPFQWWFLNVERWWWYWTWIVAMTWACFELLQISKEHDIEFVDENALVTLVLAVIIVVFGYIADAFRVRREQLVLLQQKTEAELHALKSQINPHFLFNILNTIYNEAADNERVADLVQQLAGIMRFTLQESAKPFTSIENEVAFLEKYLTLQRARLPRHEDIRLDTDINYDDHTACIAPLLLIPFVENAFQYGISLAQPCFVEMVICVENQKLTLHIRNSIVAKSNIHNGNGLGIANVRTRLKLLYPHRHQLEIKEEKGVFDVYLSIAL